MKKLKLFALAAVALLGFAGSANAEAVLLASDDFVGISFWIISMGMLAATAFFFLERGSVAAGWKNISNSCRTSNWYCIHSLRLHERCMGSNR